MQYGPLPAVTSVYNSGCAVIMVGDFSRLVVGTCLGPYHNTAAVLFER